MPRAYPEEFRCRAVELARLTGQDSRDLVICLARHLLDRTNATRRVSASARQFEQVGPQGLAARPPSRSFLTTNEAVVGGLW